MSNPTAASGVTPAPPVRAPYPSVAESPRGVVEPVSGQEERLLGRRSPQGPLLGRGRSQQREPAPVAPVLFHPDDGLQGVGADSFHVQVSAGPTCEDDLRPPAAAQRLPHGEPGPDAVVAVGQVGGEPAEGRRRVGEEAPGVGCSGQSRPFDQPESGAADGQPLQVEALPVIGLAAPVRGGESEGVAGQVAVEVALRGDGTVEERRVGFDHRTVGLLLPFVGVVAFRIVLGPCDRRADDCTECEDIFPGCCHPKKLCS